MMVSQRFNEDIQGLSLQGYFPSSYKFLTVGLGQITHVDYKTALHNLIVEKSLAVFDTMTHRALPQQTLPATMQNYRV